MATSNAFSQPSSSSPDDYFNQLEGKINSHFNNLSDLLNQRRSKILQQLSALKSAFYEAEILRNQSIKDLQIMKDAIIKPEIKSNDMVTMTEHILKTMDDKMQSLKDPTPLPIIAFADDLDLFKDSLSRCELVTMNHDWKSKNTPLVVVTQENIKLAHTLNTNKNTINTTTVKEATTNKDMRLGALAYDERRKLIYTYDTANNVCKVYDMDGKLISEFKIEESTKIYGLAFNKDCSYLYAVNSECEVNPNTVYQINANDYSIMNESKNKMGTIICVDTDSMGDVYVGGFSSVLYILSSELVIKKELILQYMFIGAIKCLPDSIIVLSLIPYQLSSFSYTGELQRVIRTEKINLLNEMHAAMKDEGNSAPCIAIDGGGLLIYPDIISHVVQIISPNGYLIHQIGSEGEQKGQFLFPTGVAVTEKGLLIVTSSNSKYPLQIF